MTATERNLTLYLIECGRTGKSTRTALD